MSDHLPAPLVSTAADLTDFKFMPLEVARLRRSKAWLICKRQPELAFYMINLWTAAWHSVPAGSLEDDDDVLADAAMCDPHKWGKLRDKIMRGWVKCSNGLLYHPVVAEKVAESWHERLEYSWRKECDRIRKDNKLRTERNETPLELPPKPERIPAERSGIPAEIALKGEVKGQGEGKGKKKEAKAQAVELEPAEAPLPEPAGDPDKVARKAMIAAFDEVQVEVYAERRRPWPAPKDWTTAGQWVEAGADLDLCRFVIETQTRKMFDAGKEPPRALSLFTADVLGAIDKGETARRPAAGAPAAVERPYEDHATMQWRSRLEGFRDYGAWSQNHGPKPPGAGQPMPPRAEYPEALAIEIGVSGPAADEAGKAA